LSKRLKRRIHDVCGLNNLSREDRVRKASAILSDPEYKQKICNEITGASYRDIEKALKSIVATKLSEEDEEHAELERDHPEKLDPTIGRVRAVKPIRLAPVLDKKEVNWLINASNKPLAEDEPQRQKDYPSYSPAEIAELFKSDK
jgi:hypothetical protein